MKKRKIERIEKVFGGPLKKVEGVKEERWWMF
jgi:hypothetical protein